MRSLIVKSAIVFAVTVGLWGALPREAAAANCQCYYSTDCPANNYCDWTAACTRHCELQEDWKPEWGQPPTSKADCDKYTGACHDNEPSPPNGDDGDGENCEPPSVPKPGSTTGEKINFKVRDGNCKKNPTPKPVGQAQRQVRHATEIFVKLADSGGGAVTQLTLDAYINTVMLNVAGLALGQYDFSLSDREGEPTWMADVRGTCGSIALQTLGDALDAEMDAALTRKLANSARTAMSRFSTGKHDGVALEEDVSAAKSVLEKMSPDCQTWVQSRPHDCQFPHPEEHHHVFDYTDGIECIAHQLYRMADSMNLVP